MPRVTIEELVTRTDNQRAMLDELQTDVDNLSVRLADYTDELTRRIDLLDTDFGEFLSETRLNRIVNDMVDRRIQRISNQYNQPEFAADPTGIVYTNIPRAPDE